MYRTVTIQLRFVYAEWGGCGVPLRPADISAGKLMLLKRGAGAAVLPNKQRLNIFLDGAVIARFKSKASERGFQTLINEELQSIQAERLDFSAAVCCARLFRVV